MADRVVTACHAGNLLYFGGLQVFAEAVFGETSQHEDTLCDLIRLFGGVVVQILEFAVQDEESVSFDIPVKSAQIRIEYLKVCQQLMQRRYYVAHFLFVQVKIIHRFHSRFIFYEYFLFLFVDTKVDGIIL